MWIGAAALFATGCELIAQKSMEAKQTPNVVAVAEPEQSTGCKVASDPFNPFIVEWPAAERTNLEAQSQAGLVVVSYVGCTLKVLAGCEAAGVYDVRHTTPNADHFDMQTEEDLYAKLPLGAATLKGELKSAGAMRFEYVAAAQSVAKAPPTALRGTCEGATHYVRSMTKGAFSLGALASSTATGGATLGNTGAGGRGDARSARARAAGDIAACLNGDESKCGAILQLGLAELSLGTQEAGFGQGLGSLVNIPLVPSASSVLPQMDFSRADPDYLELVDAAKKADKDASRTPLDKAAKWDKVAAFAGDNPNKADAEARSGAWRELARKQKERADQIEAAWTRSVEDQRKLDRLLALSEETVSQRQKDAYRKEFARVYAPWEREFAAKREAEQARAEAEAAKSRGGEFVSLPAGCFTMGGTDGEADEKPPHQVCVKAFELGRTEVTVGQYAKCVAERQCEAPHWDDGTCYRWDGSNYTQGIVDAKFRGAGQPVICVDWDQAKAFARWSSARLPTEAEWEYAARSGGGDQQYPWGNESATCAQAVMSDGGNGCGRNSTWPVCSKSAGNSAQGACDLAGNVWEWVEDWYHDSYAGAPTDGSAYISPAGSIRVGRGGSWYYDAGRLRARFRNDDAPSYRVGDLGFRLAR